MSLQRFFVTIVITLSLLGVCRAASSDSRPISTQAVSAADQSSPESVVLALYAALSFERGKAIDRNRVRSLFAPEAQILFAGRRTDGRRGTRTFTVDSFLDFATPAGESASRGEKELWRRVERFGDIAHVFSAYELRITGATGKPTVRRGINSLQLNFDGSVWQIVSLIWDVERTDNPLPDSARSNCNVPTIVARTHQETALCAQ
jgi:hypothetical protein